MSNHDSEPRPDSDPGRAEGPSWRAGPLSSLTGIGLIGVWPPGTPADGLEADAAAAAAAVEEMSCSTGRSPELDLRRERSSTRRGSAERVEGGVRRPSRRDFTTWSSMKQLWPPPQQSLSGAMWLAQGGVAAAEEDVVRAVHAVYMAAAMRAGGGLEQQARRAYEALEESSASSVAFTR